MELWMGMALAVLGIIVAAWDGWLTLKVNRNVAQAIGAGRQQRHGSQSKAPASPSYPLALPPAAHPPAIPPSHAIQLLPAPRLWPAPGRAYTRNLGTPDTGEGRKLLERGLSYLHAGNPGLALPLLRQSLELLTQAGGQREIAAARTGIESAQSLSPYFFRRTAGSEGYRPSSGSGHGPKPGSPC